MEEKAIYTSVHYGLQCMRLMFGKVSYFFSDEKLKGCDNTFARLPKVGGNHHEKQLKLFARVILHNCQRAAEVSIKIVGIFQRYCLAFCDFGQRVVTALL